MISPPGRVLLLFLDGFGVGAEDPLTNPLVRADLPVLRSLLGGRLPVEGTPAGAGERGAWWRPIDATLGVPGRPQSGTGQTALLTGENAPQRFGRHFGPWVPTGLRPLLAERNLLTRARRAGRMAAFANAYPASYLTERRGERRPAAPPLAAEAAGVLERHEDSLHTGLGVASEITHERWQRYLPDLPPVTARAAGERLVRVAGAAEVTLFAHYDTDLVGHRRDLEAAARVLERVDAFLGGVLDALTADLLLVIASDHGNIEDATTGHTVNPVPLIGVGPGAEELVGRAATIAEVTPLLLEMMNIE